MSKIALCFHGGSKNHGCEAIIRGTAKILSGNALTLFGFCTQQDKQFGLDTLAELRQVGHSWTHNITWRTKVKKFIPAFILNLRRRNNKTDYDALYKEVLACPADLFAAVGGDNYCYGDFEAMAVINKKLHSAGHKTMLWGCSVEPKDIKSNPALRADLQLYDLITARESLTYEAMLANGINKNTHLVPDPAFTLDAVIPSDLPKEFLPGNTVAINLSPMVQNLEKGGNITYKNNVNLLEYILNSTDMNIALIPHVLWEDNNDMDPLRKLYNKFKHTGRVCLIEKQYNCMELKGIISQCRFVVAARTHASIAAYSKHIPTLVIGYSVKARGIAKDIFGSYEGYVLPVQDLKTQDELTKAFKTIVSKEAEIKEHYKNFMPGYINRAYKGAEEVKKLIG